VLLLVLRAVAAVVGRVPFSWLGVLAEPIGWFVASIWRVRRRHVEHSMRRAGVVAPARSARAMYRSLAISTLELLWLAGRPIARLDGVAAIDPSSRVMLARARAQKRGIVLAASHTGNWEIAAARLAQEMDVLAVTKELRVRGFDGFARRVRQGRGLQMAHAGSIVARARDVLRAGGAVAMVIDQVPMSQRHGVPCDFLSAPAWVDRGPAVVAARSGAPLVVTAARRNRDGTHTLSVLEVHEPPPRAGRAWIQRVTVHATHALERFVRENPSEWLWLHRRWAMPAP
jgi:KDO2-lipid IV(A) lauroyltransferase